MEEKVFIPTRAHIELTSKCNFKCKICNHSLYDYGEDISPHVISIIKKEVLPHLSQVELQGTGESLLSPFFYDVFLEAKKNKDLNILLITNGSLITKELAKEFVSSNMQLTLSLDGHNGEIFRYNRPVGDFNKIISNVLTIKEERSGGQNEHFSLCVNMVLTQYNYKYLKEMVLFVKGLGVDYLFVSEIRKCSISDKDWERLRLDNMLNRESLNNTLSECSKLASDIGLGFNFNPYKEDKKIKKKLCLSPWKHLFISAKGEVSFCCELNRYFGNLNFMSLGDILNSKEVNDFRNNMLMSDYDAKCRGCCLPWGITYE